MSIASHHAEWLSLMDVSGPFLSVPVLCDAMPNGLDAYDPALAAELRAAYDAWSEPDVGGFELVPPMELHMAWVRFVMHRILGFDEDILVWDEKAVAQFAVEAKPHGVQLNPDAVAIDDHRPRLLVSVVSPSIATDEPVITGPWTASPLERTVELLRRNDCRLGLVTNGERWTLVSLQDNDNPGYATWWASLWREERITLQSFRTILSQSRFLSVPEHETLEGLLSRSAEDHREVTTKLGSQTLEAVEILIRTIDRLDRDRGGRLLADVDESELYDAAVTVMMRLIFLFFAEENDLLPTAEPLYNERYAASTLRSRLQAAADQAGEEVLETTCDAWPRLLATWRAVYGGVEHADMVLAPYGGSLFDPDRYPFLEGRLPETHWLVQPASPLPIDNRTVLHLLNALQTLTERGQRRNLSFRALDVEQIGHVYEGMLDHTAARATGWVLGLSGSGDKEPELQLDELEAYDESELIAVLREKTARGSDALGRWLNADPRKTIDEEFGLSWQSAFAGDSDAATRAARFSKLIRKNSAGAPAVFQPGSVYVCDSAHRGATGTHYTPRSLTEEVVNHALEPLVYEGPAAGAPRDEWRLRPPEKLVQLTLCDPACGSGAFLVQACRYLAEKLVESRRLSGELGQASPEQELISARREVAERCLHGVDVNPMAVEMAKLSLWLVTLAKHLPFSFVDHAIRCGDSLIGAASLTQLRRFSLDQVSATLDRRIGTVLGSAVDEHVADAASAQRLLRSAPTRSVEDVDAKCAVLEEVSHLLHEVRQIADRVIAVPLHCSRSGGDPASLLLQAALDVAGALELTDSADRTRAFDEIAARTKTLLEDGRSPVLVPITPFHWPLEFPHIFLGDRIGFDAIVGNPPFLRGRSIGAIFGDDYRKLMVASVAHGARGPADLVAYFFLRALQLVVADRGYLGLIATNSISEGDTREVGLDQVVASHATIVRAVVDVPWPGVAAVMISKLWICTGEWEGDHTVDGSIVPGISSSLRAVTRFVGQPRKLSSNSGVSGKGSEVLGAGFVLSPEEAEDLVARDPTNRDVVFPYLSGSDLMSSPTSSPSRFVINFFDWPLSAAENYPLCLERVQRLVKPKRDTDKRKARRERWWQYGEKASGLYRAIEPLENVIAFAFTSRTAVPTRVKSNMVFSNGVVVIADESWHVYAVLSSTFHQTWAFANGSRLKLDLRYTPSDVFETFPLPDSGDLSVAIQELHHHRSAAMANREWGLTAIYARVNSPADQSEDVALLREYHARLDAEVAKSYGWDGLDLSYEFSEQDGATRYVLAEKPRGDVLDRLRDLNLLRFEQESRGGQAMRSLFVAEGDE